MRTLVVTGYGVRLGFEKGLLVVKSREAKEKISIGDLDQVVIASSGVSISSRAVRALMRHGVDLVFLDARGTPAARLWLPYLTKTSLTRRKQYEAYLNGRGLDLAKIIVYSKAMNQAGLLRRLARTKNKPELREASKRIEEYVNRVFEVKGDLEYARNQLREIEAHIAREYWSSIAIVLPRSLGFEGRRHDSLDPVNVSLNYLYGVGYSTVWRELVLAGLDPYAGFIHVDRSGRPVLVYDFIEMFRVSLVDYPLVKVFSNTTWRPGIENGLLDHESRARLIKLFQENLERKTRIKYLNYSMSLREAVKHVALRLADSLRENTVFRGFIEKW